MNNVLDSLTASAGTVAGQTFAQTPGFLNAAAGSIPPQSDTIRRFPGFGDQPAGGTPLQGSIGGLMQQLLAIVQQLLQALGMGGNDQFFQAAQGSSTGDPHLAFCGTTSTGQSDRTRFDSMTAHADLLDSDSFTGGYQISTSVTQPNASGVTYNQSATIATNSGGTQVSLDNAADANVNQNGTTTALSDGQTINLGDGESVTRNGDGSVVVTDYSGTTGIITTTLSQNGQGVNVNVQAQNVALGGDLAAAAFSSNQGYAAVPFP
jgi:hypothetical protein